MSYILNSYIEEINETLSNIENELKNNCNNKEKIKKLFENVENDISLLKLEYNNNNINNNINNDPNCRVVLSKYDQLKLQFNKSQLISNETFNNNSNNQSTNFNSSTNETREKILNLNKMMDNNTKMIQSARQEISSMTTLATDLSNTLHSQTEQMKNMDKKFDSIDANIDKSPKTIDKMSKRWF
ncbi:hypothetical protein DDB_G0275765 [Dictyostelium discoideum AX4]|uniref:t-SNARE coiled-coil homology domain-containing protein n=1 Tax=Dictyostelium discoideum TaxID=44689 RepID=Q553C3_DICDI|nr:hypothetical protein DDB_G0275765 [Dictyostelium discoideum AX4]EAL69633.1 hypothetical protein DDB_G0275765 [Dictyostelium discoideum AX4]|eukprot:XP_643497.1 hypothetical protein DDB_G0275765 [Dictyostelium discoideum AX4]